MNNKGFTLVELLVTITLIAAVSVTIGLSVSGLLNRNSEKEWKDYKDKIAKAACTYAEIKENKTNAEVTIETLINEGYLKKNIKNPKTGKAITEYTDHIIEINWVNNERNCEYNPSETE